MKKLIAAALFATVLSGPAFANTFTLVQDIYAGNCSAVITAEGSYPGMRRLSETTYPSQQDADKALDSVTSCKSFLR